MQEITKLKMSQIIDYSFRNSMKSFKQIVIFSLLSLLVITIANIPFIAFTLYWDFDLVENVNTFRRIVILIALVISILPTTTISIFYVATLLDCSTSYYLNGIFNIKESFKRIKKLFWNALKLLFFLVTYFSMILGFSYLISRVLFQISFIDFFTLNSSSIAEDIYYFIVILIIALAFIFVIFSPSIMLEKDLRPINAIIESMKMVWSNFIRVVINGISAAVIYSIVTIILFVLFAAALTIVLNLFQTTMYGENYYLILGFVYLIMMLPIFSIIINIVLSHIAILYYDIKVRKEGWAIEQMINKLDTLEPKN